MLSPIHSKTEWIEERFLPMNMTQLKCLTAILDTGSFTEAAYQLFMTQSSVSKQIAALERELGIALFHRQGRGAEPTDFCRQFSEEARGILRLYESALRKAKTFARNGDSRVLISSIPAVIPYQLDALFSAFRRKYPHLTLQIEEKEPSEVLHDLSTGLCDFAILRDFFLSADYHSLPLGSDRLAAVLPRQHPLAQARELSLSQLAAEDWILLSRNTGMYDFVLGSCAACGFRPRILWTLSRISHVLDSVAAGKGVSLLMRQTLFCHQHPDVVAVPLKEPFESRLLLLRQQDTPLSDPASTFLNFAEKVF